MSFTNKWETLSLDFLPTALEAGNNWTIPFKILEKTIFNENIMSNKNMDQLSRFKHHKQII